jgi:hypothetical protein
MLEYIPCYSAPELHWYLLPATRLASRKIEQNIKKWTGPALCVLYGEPSNDRNWTLENVHACILESVYYPKLKMIQCWCSQQVRWRFFAVQPKYELGQAG